MAKYEITIKCRTKALKEKIETQITSTFRKNIIMGVLKSSHDSNDIRLDISKTGMFVPMIAYGYEENLHTETEFDKASNFEISIQCHTGFDAETVANLIHDQLVGLDDYINTKILLNRDGKKVFVCFGAECDYYPILVFINEMRLK